MSRYHILIVEDDEALVAGVREVLEMEGYRVSSASDGVQALQVLEALPYPPDLILSDVGMPNMDGYQFLEAVRARPEWLSIPFIFLSAWSEKAAIRQGRLRGADDYVPKPFDYEDLLTAIRACLARRRELTALGEARLAMLKRQILHVINHEFRTPLTHIVAYADLMAKSAPVEHSQELRRYADGILHGSERLSRLIDSFLILAELESGFGQKIYERRRAEITDLGKLVSEVVEAARRLAPPLLVLDLSVEGAIPVIVGDVTYLTVAVRHLVENAVKFSPRDRRATVKIALRADKQHVEIAVSDEGCGIPPEEQEHLFDFLVQINREEMEQQGIGAGLAIVWHVAHLHGGQVVVESEVGKGSCFRLRLPVASAPEEGV